MHDTEKMIGPTITKLSSLVESANDPFLLFVFLIYGISFEGGVYHAVVEGSFTRVQRSGTGDLVVGWIV